MDKELLKQKLHEQIDAIEDEQALQMLHEAAIEYGKQKMFMRSLALSN